jgi:hypothetical protein
MKNDDDDDFFVLTFSSLWVTLPDHSIILLHLHTKQIILH